METKTAKNSLAGKVTTTPVKKEQTIFDIIQAGTKQFETALPKHMNTERFVRVAITTIRQNPKLATCKKESLLGALMTMAQLGLEPGVMGQAYLIPYGTECNFQISYKGMIELLRRTGQLKDIYAYVVKDSDVFEIEYGLERNLKHKPVFKEESKATGYYAVAILKDGTKAFDYMTKEEIEIHMKKFSKTYEKGPWKTDFDAMAKKTVVKQLLKWLPVSVEFIENMNKDDKQYVMDDKKNEVKEVEEVEVLADETIELDGELIDTTTGEIIEEKPTSEDLKTLISIADGNGLDITKVAKEKYKIVNLDDMTMNQFRELKEIAIEGK